MKGGLFLIISFQLLLTATALSKWYNLKEWKREQSCNNADWWSTMDRPGLSKCPDNSPYITGLYRSARAFSDTLSRLEEARCCGATEYPRGGASKECENTRWRFGRWRANWNTCKDGFFLSGIVRGQGAFLDTIKSGRCCRPVGHPDKYAGCYHKDVSRSFDREGWSQCDQGYYLAGLYKSRCIGLFCIETFKCCRMVGQGKPCALKPCKNGGTCTDKGSTFSCRCPTGFIGRTCETVPPSPCNPNPCKNGGQCEIIGNRYSCRCKPQYGGSECQHDQATCSARGDPHYTTFDKRKFDFMGNCEFTLAEDCSVKKQFTILARSSRCGWGAATCTQDVTIYLHKTKPQYRISWSRARNSVVINGQKYTSFPIKRSGFTMNNPSVLVTDIGVSVTWNYVTDVSVTVSGQYKNKMCGLCGNFDGNSWNDWPKPGLKCAIPPTGCFPSEKKAAVMDKCSLIGDASSPFAACHTVVDPATFIDNCRYDSCRCDDPTKCLCDAIAMYTTQCADHGKVISWRFKGTNLYKSLKECAKTCANPEEIFTECGSSCVTSCRDLSRDTQCNEQCIPRCQCAGGEVLNEQGKCVPREQCSCPYEGKMYKPGESVDVGNCKTCTCSEGAMTCVDDRDCSEKGPCDSQPCKNDGICKQEGKDFICTCTGEYEGKTCEKPKPKPCDSSPCENNGICTNTGETSYTCECVGYFKGPNCKVPIPKPCDSKPCKNGAACYDEGQEYYCECKKGFTGKTCGEPEKPSACESSPCKNNGVCIDYKETFVCKCTEEFMGKTCEKPTSRPCDSNPCKNGAKCYDNPTKFYCKCPDNFVGVTCEDPKPKPCDSSPCKNGGKCTNTGECSFSCACEGGFEGVTCEKEPKPDACKSSPCLNDGKCINDGDGFVCKCTDEYSGEKCEIPTKKPCDSSPCENGGTCIDRCHSFECDCTEGFEGETCEKVTKPEPDPCESSPCKNGGECMSEGDSFACKCTDKYTGEKCEVTKPEPDPCESSPCKNGGECMSEGDSFACKCTDKYTGEKCEGNHILQCFDNFDP